MEKHKVVRLQLALLNRGIAAFFIFENDKYVKGGIIVAKYEMLRSALFGGYNKEDVHNYIQNLENEIEATKALCQQEINSLKKELDKEKETELTKEEQEKLQEEAAEKAEAFEQSQEELRRTLVELQDTKEAYEKIQADLREKNELAAKQQKMLLEQEKCLQQQEEELKELRKQQEELHCEGKIQESSNDSERTECQMEQDYDFLDKETIRKVLEDAYENARLIEADAQRERERIIREANQEAEEQKKTVVSRIRAELEEKGIQLMAAKHKIDKYVKEIENAQQGLYMIHTRMNQMVQSMPVRADNYWEGYDEWKQLTMEGQKENEPLDIGSAEGEEKAEN